MKPRFYYILSGVLLFATASVFVIKIVKASAIRAFTVNFTSTATDLKTGKVSVNYQILAQRTDGTVASRQATPVGPVITVDSFTEMMSIRIDPTHGNKWTTYYAAAEVADLQSRPSSANKCSAVLASGGIQYLGEGTLLGHTVYQYGAGQFLTNQNRYDYLVELAPELNCLWVRQDTLRLDDQGKPLSNVVEVATAISIGDPDPSLFQAAGEAREVTPSKYFMDLNGVDALDKFQPCVQDAIKRYAKFYADNHKLNQPAN